MKEEDIRKREIFDQYLEMVKEDIGIFFNDSSSFIRIPCPACNGQKHTFQFNKAGFDYMLEFSKNSS